MIDRYRHREELGNFALEIYQCPSGMADWEVEIQRFHEAEMFWEKDAWLYIHESHRLFDNFADALVDARYRMLQYFKSDCFNTDKGIEQDWFQEH